MTFTPLIDFESPELASSYCAGLTYTVRAGDERLRALLPQWVMAGKVRLGASAAAPVARLSGVGLVTGGY